jgi:hypothetical protein
MKVKWSVFLHRFWRHWFQFMARSLAVLSKCVRILPQPSQSNSGILLQKRLRLVISNTSLTVIIQFDATTYKPSLNKDNKQLNLIEIIMDTWEELRAGKATGYGLDDRGVGVRVPVGSRIFSSPRGPVRLWSRPNLLSDGELGVLSPGIKRPGHEADYSPPSSAEVKKM